MDVIVVGAGVIGCAIARELALVGARVLVLERDSPGRGASWAAAGMLSPLGEAQAADPYLELSDASLSAYPAFAEALQAETGIDIKYRTQGKLHVSLRGEADDALRALAAGELGARFGAHLVEPAAARLLVPALSGDLSLAVLVARDHRVHNRQLARALPAAATSAGAVLRTGTAVAAIETTGGGRGSSRVSGVRLTSGERVPCGTVVVAAGAWSAGLEGLPRPLPVRPIRGQMFALDARAHTASRPEMAPLEHVLMARNCYIIPREPGRLLVGATTEDVGFRRGPTPRGLTQLMTAATDILPAAAELPISETWFGFRPATPDGLPILGREPLLPGLIYATGHFRNGILLAPITARIVAELCAAPAVRADLSAFAAGRFEESTQSPDQ